MGYTLTSAEKAPLLDGDGNPLATADITDAAGTAPPFTGPVLSVKDDGAGNLQVTGNSPGTVVGLVLRQVSTGAEATHDIVVTEPPFDWTLGAPVAK